MKITISLLAPLLILHFASAHADVISSSTVQSTDVIYAAGNQAASAAGAGGTAPGFVSAAGTYFTFSVSGNIVLNNGSGNNMNDADGAHSAVGSGSSFNSGTSLISGITAPGAGYLVGVFLAPGGPSGAAPSALDYTSTSGTSYSPLLDQVFFIGDGLTGDGSGTTQTFYVPTGATELFLGISDACGYNGSPSCYADNLGSFAVTTDDVGAGAPATTPEPSSLILLGTGALGIAGAVRRRIRP